MKYAYKKYVFHDHGTEFNNILFKELNTLCRIKQLGTTPYHPMGNGTILSMLRTLEESQESKWKERLTKVNYAYNSTRNGLSLLTSQISPENFRSISRRLAICNNL